MHLNDYPDDNTLYSFGNELEEIRNILRFNIVLVTKWLVENYLVLNVGKCHFMLLGKGTEK